MRSSTTRALSGLTLAALLLAPTLAASAQDSTVTGLQLDLEAALAAPGSAFAAGVEAEAAGGAAEAATAEISLSEVRAEAWALDEGEDDPAAAMKPEKKGFGRWLKKRWYVPVLAAAVLAVALDDDDNDAAGEED